MEPRAEIQIKFLKMTPTITQVYGKKFNSKQSPED